MSYFTLFYRVVLPFVFLATAVIQSVSASAFLLNQPSDLAVFGGVVLVPAVCLAVLAIAKRLWFPRRRS